MDDLISRFRDYQIEWLTSHNDIEFCEEEEKLIIGFLKDTAESFVLENQSEQQWVPPRRCIDCENFNKTQLLVQQAKQKWIPCSERLPDDGTYLCWEWQGFCYVDSFKNGNWETAEKCYTKCIAWMPLPEPYKEGENG